MGCRGTFLGRVTSSGMGANNFHMMLDLRRALVWNKPVQMAPLMLDMTNEPKDTIGYTYTFGGCPSNFLDCYYLDHSPCPPIAVDPYIVLPEGHRSRVRAWNHANLSTLEARGFDQVDKWWDNVFRPQKDYPYPSITPYPGVFYDSPNSLAVEQVLYSYLFRPKYSLRAEMHQLVTEFALDSLCAVVHVRRGDAVTEDRRYMPLLSYIREGRPMLDAMDIRTVLLLSDSQAVIDEATECVKNITGPCGGITFRYVAKKRWYGAEGGWQSHFPSGSPRTELRNVHLEFALSNQCQVIHTILLT